MTTKEDIQKLLEANPEYKEKLFIRGYYFTNDEVHPHDYPFYDNWNHEKILGYNLLVHNKQHYYIHKFNNDKSAMILVGHAYNPFTMQYKESEILEGLAALHGENFWNKFNELTGIFTLIIINKNKTIVVGDATCKQSNLYGLVKDKFYLSSHINLINDLVQLKINSYITKLCSYKFFPMLGLDIPGDLTKYEDIKRCPPNNYIKFASGNITVERFYQPQKIIISEDKLIKTTTDLLKKNMNLITKKWKKPAISLTGGCDSKTTLACANGLYDKYITFSYSSNEAEEVDAQAAKKISSYLNINHKYYYISDKNEDFKNIEIVKKLINYNKGNYCKDNDNDIRKRHYFSNIKDFDVEVKSWISELGRTYYCQRFLKQKGFGKISPRKCTTIYKYFLHNRHLVKQTDKVFKIYIEQFFNQRNENSIDWQDQFDWEHRTGGWEGYVITAEHKYSYDITIPYNNRKIIELLINAAFINKYNDKTHMLIRNTANPKIDDLDISVTNIKHTKNRARFEHIYYTLHSHFPW